MAQVVRLGQKKAAPKKQPNRAILWISLFCAMAGLWGLFCALLFLTIQETQIQIPIYPPQNSTVRHIDPNVWVEYSKQREETSNKPFYYLADLSITMPETNYTRYIFVSRPFWWRTVPGAHQQGEYYITFWNKNFLFGIGLLIVAISDMAVGIRTFIFISKTRGEQHAR